MLLGVGMKTYEFSMEAVNVECFGGSHWIGINSKLCIRGLEPFWSLCPDWEQPGCNASQCLCCQGPPLGSPPASSQTSEASFASSYFGLIRVSTANDVNALDILWIKDPLLQVSWHVSHKCSWLSLSDFASKARFDLRRSKKQFVAFARTWVRQQDVVRRLELLKDGHICEVYGCTSTVRTHKDQRHLPLITWQATWRSRYWRNCRNARRRFLGPVISFRMGQTEKEKGEALLRRIEAGTAWNSGLPKRMNQLEVISKPGPLATPLSQ